MLNLFLYLRKMFMQFVTLPVAFSTLVKGVFPKSSFSIRTVQVLVIQMSNIEDEHDFWKAELHMGIQLSGDADVRTRHNGDVPIQVNYAVARSFPYCLNPVDAIPSGYQRNRAWGRGEIYSLLYLWPVVFFHCEQMH